MDMGSRGEKMFPWSVNPSEFIRMDMGSRGEKMFPWSVNPTFML